VDEDCVTLLLDEIDRIKNREKLQDMTRLLNGSTSRSFGWVERCEPSGRKIERRSFCVFGPKAVAGIDVGTLPETFLDRSVHIVLQRRAKNKIKVRLRRDEGRFEEVRRKLARWTEEVGEKLGDPEFEFPEHTSERHEEAWEPLLEIAQIAGGRWPRLAQQACAVLTRPDDEAERDSWKVALLSDCRRVYSDEPEGHESIARDRLCDYLKALDEPTRLWLLWGKEDKGLTPSQMRSALRSFDIHTRDVRDPGLDGGKMRGYRWEDFEDAWGSYLPADEEERG
jgi:putative DNA primase/helicase